MTSSNILQNYIPYTAVRTILNEFSEDIYRDCLVVSEKLLKSINEKNYSFASCCSSVKALLKIYETAVSKPNHLLTDRKIITNLKYMLQKSIKNFEFLNDATKSDIFSIVSSVLTIVKKEKPLGDVEELTEIYNYLLSSINGSFKDCDESKKLIFELEILTLIYNGRFSLAFGFGEKLKPVDDLIVEMNPLFTSLIFCSDSKAAVQTIMYLIPAFIKFVKSNQVLESFWLQISDCVSQSKPLKYHRVLMWMCNCFYICFNDPTTDANELGFKIIKDPNFWNLITTVLVNQDSVIRKQGRYLLQEAVNQLKQSCFFIKIASKNNFFYLSEYKHMFVSYYYEIINILEFLEEQQFHIIEPIFEKVENLWNMTIDLALDLYWIFLIYKRLNMHESTQVVKWGVSNFLKIPNDFFSNEYIAEKSALLLADSLNNPNLYYSNCLVLIQELKDFFKRITTLSSSKIFFSSFIKRVCSKFWSDETLFFVMHSLSGIKKFSFWGKEEISLAKQFVSNVFETHDIAIRIGTQHELLCAFSNLTDEKTVSLENVILFISSFSTKEVVKLGSPAWDVVIDWLQSSFPKEQFENLLEMYKRKELRNAFNEKCVALMLILFYCTYELNVEDSSVMSYFREMLASFTTIHRRPYCDNSLHDQYLSIINHIYEISNAMTDFKKSCLPFVRDIILYIYTQLRQVSNLQDFSTCQLHLNAFEITIKNLILIRIDSEDVNDLFEEISEELESSSPPIVSVELYWRIRILRVIVTSYNFEPKPSFLQFLLNSVNDCLTKADKYSETSQDFQKLWGVINSEFLDDKWKILSHLFNCKPVILHQSSKKRFTSDDLFNLTLEACLKGPTKILSSVLFFLKKSFAVMKIKPECERVFKLYYAIISSSYGETGRVLVQQFFETFFQECVILQEELVQNILLKITEKIFQEDYCTISIFMKHIHKLKIRDSVPLFCEILAQGLIWNDSEKKERLICTVYSHIEILKICCVGETNSFIFPNEICARSVEKILKLDKNSSDDQKFARSLVERLIRNNEISSNIHKANRIGLRLTQALLLLEPILCPNENLVDNLSDWLFNCLTKENLHPGVRYLQEWLLIRMLLRHSELRSRFYTLNNVRSFTETGKKGLCSLMAISFHLCSLISPDETEKRIQSEIPTILSLCFHQNFEVRLYALVIFQELYKLAQNRKFNELTYKYEKIYYSMTECFEKSLKGNMNKNMSKLMNNFYFKNFNPLDHYSLQSVYWDLPKLTNVNPDEWISSETFQYCGVEFDKVDFFTNPAISLSDAGEIKCFTEKFTSEVNFAFGMSNPDCEKIKNEVVYHQKKIIPVNSLFPGWNGDNDYEIRRQNGLIVVASLVDCIPNLGGLARSCEIFGVSKFIVHSSKYVQDKQFTSLSVTAEKWITIKELKSDMLFVYLTKMKQNGFTVVGAEQALNSVSLNSIKFPKKSILVLGNEKKGIPPNILPLLDICAEIPQLGKIRSLNVHVAGALFMWEYAKQNKFF